MKSLKFNLFVLCLPLGV